MMDCFIVSLTGTVIEAPRISPNTGTVFCVIQVINKGAAPIFVEIMAQETAAEITRHLYVGSKVRIIDAMGFVGKKANGCHFSVGVRKSTDIVPFSENNSTSHCDETYDKFSVTLTGNIISDPQLTDKGTAFFSVITKTRSGVPLYVQVMAKASAADKVKSFVERDDKICLINVMGFCSNNPNGCNISVGVSKGSCLHLISQFDGIVDANTLISC